MKKAKLAIICLLALCACSKTSVKRFSGDYSFKTSGTLTVERILPEGDSTIPTSFTVKLPNEIGQLEISALNSDEDSVLVVMNTLGGEVIVTHAYCDGNQIFLRDFVKSHRSFNLDNLFMDKDLQVSGQGEIFDDNTLIINMTYQGEAHNNLIDYSLYGNDIRMAATRN